MGAASQPRRTSFIVAHSPVSAPTQRKQIEMKTRDEGAAPVPNSIGSLGRERGWCVCALFCEGGFATHIHTHTGVRASKVIKREIKKAKERSRGRARGSCSIVRRYLPPLFMRKALSSFRIEFMQGVSFQGSFRLH